MTSTEGARQEWPSETYLATWKAFRGTSNENVVTAVALLRHPLWPLSTSLTICDIGCGDGKVTQEIVRQSSGTVREVRLVDPDDELLDEAVQALTAEGLETIVRYAVTAAHALPTCAETADVALLVHVVYLLPDGELQLIFDRMPIGVPLFLVMDAPDSVFTSLWAESAPKYHARSIGAHATIGTLPRDKYRVDASRLSSSLPDPRRLQVDRKITLLSILCYTDTSRIAGDANLMATAEAILSRFATNGQIKCESMCYVITRLS